MRPGKIFIAAFSLLVLMLAACNGPTAEEDRAIYDTVFGRFLKLNNTGRAAEAFRYVDSLPPPRSDDPTGYVLAWYKCKMSAYYYKHQLDSNAMYTDSMQQLLEHRHMEQRFSTQYVNILSTKADIAFAGNDMVSAFEYYSRSKIIAEQLKDQCIVANQEYHLGMVCYRQERYAQAIEHFKAAITTNVSCDNNEFSLYRNTELLGDLGLSYARIRNYDSALAYYRRSVEFVQTRSRSLKINIVRDFAAISTGVAYGNMAAVYMEQGKYDSAEYLLHKNIEINDREGYEQKDALSSYIRLAELYHQQHRPAQMAAALDSVQIRLRSFPNRTVQLRWLRLMQERYRTQPDDMSAWRYVDRYISLRDTIDAKNKGSKQVGYGQLLKTKDAQFQVSLLKKDNQLNRIYLFVAISSVVLILGVILLVYSSYRKSKKNVAILTRMNDQVNDQKQRLEEAMVLLRQSNNDKDRILHVMAHDLSDPIGAVISLIDLLQKDAAIPAQQKQLLHMMHGASASALALIRELLRSASDGKDTQQKEVTDLSYLVKMAAQLLQHKADEKQQTIDLLLPTTPVNVSAQAEKLTRVFSNLISNAVKFSSSGAVIYVEVTPDAAHVRITVADNGIGIPEEDQPFIFDLFTTARQRGTAGEHSFGLGLSICRQIVEAHNGKIWFESTAHKGSSFYVELPLLV